MGAAEKVFSELGWGLPSVLFSLGIIARSAAERVTGYHGRSCGVWRSVNERGHSIVQFLQ